MRLLHCTESPALVSRERTVTYAGLCERVNAYAALLPEKCEKVAICSENRFEWVYSLYSGWKKGSAVVPIDCMASAEEVAFILGDCRPEVLFCSSRKLPDIEEALRSASFAPKIMVFEDLPEDAPGSSISAKPILERNDSDVALIVYTSGTTGSPKGAMLSFDNLLANVEAVSEGGAPIFTPGSKTLVLLPVHHILPLMGTVIIPLSVGGVSVFSPSMASEDIIETLQRGEVNIIVAVPRFYNLIMKGIREKIGQSFAARTLFSLAKRVDSPAFSRKLFKKVHQRFGGHIRFMVCGGAAIDEDVARDYKALGFDMLLGYGMTEAAPMISFTRPGTMKIGASGEASPANEVRIVDGEIVAKGRNVMLGYYDRPEETAVVIRDGWLHTGDLGCIDSDGFVFVTGRKKDIIVLPNGKNVNPEEIEFKIQGEFDSVKEIAVFLHEDVLHAVIFPDFQRLAENGVHAVEDFFRWKVIDAYNQQASPAKKIMKFSLIREELPKTRLGKIRRFQLAGLISRPSSPGREHEEPQTQVYSAIKQFLGKQTGKDVFADMHLEIDLGMDSLDKVALSAFLNSSFGVEMRDDVLLGYPTVGALAGYVESSKTRMEEEEVDWSAILHEEGELELPTISSFHAPFGRAISFLFKRYFRMSATGLEHIPDSPFMLVANHQSYLDGLAIASFLDAEAIKRLYFYAGERHFRKSWQRAFAAKHNVILVDINRKLKESLQKMAKVLKSGHSMLLFPEGTRTRDGMLQPFKKTFAILSRELAVPVVPVVLKGAFEAMPRGRAVPKFRQRLLVNFLPAVYPGALEYEELTEKVYALIKEGMEMNAQQGAC